jgi:NAD(P)-dependent dehydrogenase (short-subunit alcohol dehydrogenase family)|tara:strand:+ start:1324 stop:2139 length:816 start_codon:yes stop_codon:yes gene_type:complete
MDEFNLNRLFDLKGKTALITGGSSGLGLIMAKGLLQNGARVLIASRKQKKSDMALIELEKYGDCFAVTADVTKSDDRVKIVTAVDDCFDGLSILINNAGGNWGAKLEDYPDDGFEKVISTNLNAVFSLTRDLIPQLARSATDDDPGRIINIGSMDGIHVPIVQRVPTFAYSASKAALHHLTKALAIDLAPKKITVNAVAPGFFESRMTDYVFKHFITDIEDDCPLHRIGRPEELVGIVAYLASRAGAYTNGAVIPVDGGTSISKGRRPWTE